MAELLQTSDQSEGRTVETAGTYGQAPDVVSAGDLVVTQLDEKGRSEAVRFVHEVAELELRLEGHGGRMSDRHALYRRVEAPAEQRA